jgi:hypothetical protein
MNAPETHAPDLSVAPTQLKLVDLNVVQSDLFARAVRDAAKAKTPAEARKSLEKLGAIFDPDGRSFRLAGLEARLAGNPALERKRHAQSSRRSTAKAARKARRESRRG